MKLKSALIMLICCIICIVFSITEMYKFYNKLKKQEISLKKFILILMAIIYAIILSGFAAYSYYTGLFGNFLSMAFMPFGIITMWVCIKILYKKPLPPHTAKGRLILALLASIIFTYIGLIGFYKAIYIPYHKCLFN